MKVDEFIALMKEKTQLDFTEGEIISWINEVEQKMYTEHINEFVMSYIPSENKSKINVPIPKFMIEKVEAIKNDEVLETIYDKENRGGADNVEMNFLNDDGTIDNKWGDCTLKIFHKYTPTVKTNENANYLNLNLMNYGYQWIELYEYYCSYKANLKMEEFQVANNFANLYNEAVVNFELHLRKNEYNRSVKKVEKRWE